MHLFVHSFTFSLLSLSPCRFTDYRQIYDYLAEFPVDVTALSNTWHHYLARDSGRAGNGGREKILSLDLWHVQDCLHSLDPTSKSFLSLVMLNRVIFYLFNLLFLFLYCFFSASRTSLGKLWINNYPSRDENSCWQLSIFTPIINHFLLLISFLYFMLCLCLSLSFTVLANWAAGVDCQADTRGRLDSVRRAT